MPILIDNVEFDFGYGNSSFYEANAGDEVRALMNIRSLMRVTTYGNPLTLDVTTGQVQSPSTSWLEEGFRVGDWVRVERLTQTGGLMVGWWTQVQYVDDVMCDFDFMPPPMWYDITNNEGMTFTVTQGPTMIPSERDEVDVLLNHVLNSVAGTFNSMIDGEVTRARMSGIQALPIGNTINGIILGNQSGQFLISASLTKLSPVDIFTRYRIRVRFVNSGMYDSGTWFFSSDCIKAYISTQWARTVGEPFARYVSLYNSNANTGYYNEPYNTGTIDSSVIGGISEIDYCSPTQFTIIVDGPTSDIMLGACYLPTDVTYYKNQLPSQNNLTMIVPSTPITIGATFTSFLNPSGAGYTITINNISVSGSQTTITCTFAPNAAFETFIDGRDPLDRRFLVWVKCGSINHLVFDNQLTCAPVPAGPLVMINSAAFVDHAYNFDTYAGSFDDTEFNTEDDFAYYGEFRMTKGETYDRFNVYVEAVNNVTGEDFSLRVIQFNFSGVPISGDGRYLLNETISVNSALLSTSEKIDAHLRLQPILDTPTEYGVSIYAPFLLDWRYWIPYPSASTDFWPNQNKNWQQYEAGDWNVQLKLELVQDGMGYVHTDNIIVMDYDSQPLIFQQIELYEDATNTNVPIILEGQLHRVVATHTLLGGMVWDPNSIWGMITIEPFENNPRWICSTAVPFDNNSNNPLYPLNSQLLINIQYPAANVAVLECYFNPDLINLTNGVKFTTKIKGCPRVIEGLAKTTAPDDLQKTTTDSNDKTLA